jgi:hypothetical protein
MLSLHGIAGFAAKVGSRVAARLSGVGWFFAATLAVAFVGIAQPPSAHAHLLNMTEVDLLAQRDGSVQLTVNIDLSRSMQSPQAYFELADTLERPDHRALWQRIGDAIVLQNSALRLGQQRVPLVFVKAENPDNYTQRDFSDPLIWPKVLLTYRSQGQPAVADYALGITFTSGFFFEEPISVAMASERHPTRINRWLVTDQTSPQFMGGPAGTPADQPLNVQDLGIMLASGFAHVLPVGVDHLLFLLGLSLLIVSVKKLVAAVSLFTLAHCISLLASSFKIIELPPLLIELAILGTIVWLGLRLLGWRLTRPWQRSAIPSDQVPASLSYLSVFFFGLIHGLGFSNAFLAFAITENILSQLVAINVGVELAQILFIVASSLLLHRLLLPRVGAVRMHGFVGWPLIILPSLWVALLLVRSLA